MLTYEERQSNKILKGMNGFQLGGNSDSVEKAIEFVKTEKEVFDHIDKNITKINEKIALLEGENKMLETSIGYKPTKSDYHYMYDAPEGEKKFPYMRYEYGYETKEDDAYSPQPVLGNFSISGNVTMPGKDMKKEYEKKYNNNCYSIGNCMNQKFKLEVVKRNLDPKSNKKHKLDSYDIRKYGF